LFHFPFEVLEFFHFGFGADGVFGFGGGGEVPLGVLGGAVVEVGAVLRLGGAHAPAFGDGDAFVGGGAHGRLGRVDAASCYNILLL